LQDGGHTLLRSAIDGGVVTKKGVAGGESNISRCKIHPHEKQPGHIAIPFTA